MQRKLNLLFSRIERHELHESINRRSGDLGASLIADKTHISSATCIFARSYTTSYPKFSMLVNGASNHREESMEYASTPSGTKPL